jgi:hypothetical protein
MKTTLLHWPLSALALALTACSQTSDNAPFTPEGPPPPQTVNEAPSTGEAAPEITTERDVERAFETLRDSSEAKKAGHGFVVVPAGVALFDKSITEWTEEWWKWTLSLPAAESPQLVLEQGCGVGQDDPIFYVPGFSGQTPDSVRTCNVPFGQLVLFPARVVVNDYPCPDPAFQPAEGQSLRDFLTDGAAALLDTPSVLKVTVDGVEVDTSRHRHTTPVFDFTGDISLQSTFDSCITGTEQQGVSDGAWLALALSPGKHVVRMTDNMPDGTPGSRTAIIDVAKP